MKFSLIVIVTTLLHSVQLKPNQVAKSRSPKSDNILQSLIDEDDQPAELVPLQQFKSNREFTMMRWSLANEASDEEPELLNKPATTHKNGREENKPLPDIPKKAQAGSQNSLNAKQTRNEGPPKGPSNPKQSHQQLDKAAPSTYKQLPKVHIDPKTGSVHLYKLPSVPLMQPEVAAKDVAKDPHSVRGLKPASSSNQVVKSPLLEVQSQIKALPIEPQEEQPKPKKGNWVKKMKKMKKKNDENNIFDILDDEVEEIKPHGEAKLKQPKDDSHINTQDEIRKASSNEKQDPPNQSPSPATQQKNSQPNSASTNAAGPKTNGNSKFERHEIIKLQPSKKYQPAYVKLNKSSTSTHQVATGVGAKETAERNTQMIEMIKNQKKMELDLQKDDEAPPIQIKQSEIHEQPSNHASATGKSQPQTNLPVINGQDAELEIDLSSSEDIFEPPVKAQTSKPNVKTGKQTSSKSSNNEKVTTKGQVNTKEETSNTHDDVLNKFLQKSQQNVQQKVEEPIKSKASIETNPFADINEDPLPTQQKVLQGKSNSKFFGSMVDDEELDDLADVQIPNHSQVTDQVTKPPIKIDAQATQDTPKVSQEITPEELVETIQEKSNDENEDTDYDYSEEEILRAKVPKTIIPPARIPKSDAEKEKSLDKLLSKRKEKKDAAQQPLEAPNIDVQESPQVIVENPLPQSQEAQQVQQQQRAAWLEQMKQQKQLKAPKISQTETQEPEPDNNMSNNENLLPTTDQEPDSQSEEQQQSTVDEVDETVSISSSQTSLETNTQANEKQKIDIERGEGTSQGTSKTSQWLGKLKKAKQSKLTEQSKESYVAIEQESQLQSTEENSQKSEEDIYKEPESDHEEIGEEQKRESGEESLELSSQRSESQSSTKDQSRDPAIRAKGWLSSIKQKKNKEQLTESTISLQDTQQQELQEEDKQQLNSVVQPQPIESIQDDNENKTFLQTAKPVQELEDQQSDFDYSEEYEESSQEYEESSEESLTSDESDDSKPTQLETEPQVSTIDKSNNKQRLESVSDGSYDDDDAEISSQQNIQETDDDNNNNENAPDSSQSEISSDSSEESEQGPVHEITDDQPILDAKNSKESTQHNASIINQGAGFQPQVQSTEESEEFDQQHAGLLNQKVENTSDNSETQSETYSEEQETPHERDRMYKAEPAQQHHIDVNDSNQLIGDKTRRGKKPIALSSDSSSSEDTTDSFDSDDAQTDTEDDNQTIVLRESKTTPILGTEEIDIRRPSENKDNSKEEIQESSTEEILGKQTPIFSDKYTDEQSQGESILEVDEVDEQDQQPKAKENSDLSLNASLDQQQRQVDLDTKASTTESNQDNESNQKDESQSQSEDHDVFANYQENSNLAEKLHDSESAPELQSLLKSTHKTKKHQKHIQSESDSNSDKHIEQQNGSLSRQHHQPIKEIMQTQTEQMTDSEELKEKPGTKELKEKKNHINVDAGTTHDLQNENENDYDRGIPFKSSVESELSPQNGDGKNKNSTKGLQISDSRQDKISDSNVLLTEEAVYDSEKEDFYSHDIYQQNSVHDESDSSEDGTKVTSISDQGISSQSSISTPSNMNEDAIQKDPEESESKDSDLYETELIVADLLTSHPVEEDSSQTFSSEADSTQHDQSFTDSSDNDSIQTNSTGSDSIQTASQSESNKTQQASIESTQTDAIIDDIEHESVNFDSVDKGGSENDFKEESDISAADNSKSELTDNPNIQANVLNLELDSSELNKENSDSEDIKDSVTEIDKHDNQVDLENVAKPTESDDQIQINDDPNNDEVESNRPNLILTSENSQQLSKTIDLTNSLEHSEQSEEAVSEKTESISDEEIINDMANSLIRAETIRVRLEDDSIIDDKKEWRSEQEQGIGSEEAAPDDSLLRQVIEQSQEVPSGLAIDKEESEKAAYKPSSSEQLDSKFQEDRSTQETSDEQPSTSLVKDDSQDTNQDQYLVPSEVLSDQTSDQIALPIQTDDKLNRSYDEFVTTEIGDKTDVQGDDQNVLPSEDFMDPPPLSNEPTILIKNVDDDSLDNKARLEVPLELSSNQSDEVDIQTNELDNLMNSQEDNVKASDGIDSNTIIPPTEHDAIEASYHRKSYLGLMTAINDVDWENVAQDTLETPNQTQPEPEEIRNNEGEKKNTEITNDLLNIDVIAAEPDPFIDEPIDLVDVQIESQMPIVLNTGSDAGQKNTSAPLESLESEEETVNDTFRQTPTEQAVGTSLNNQSETFIYILYYEEDKPEEEGHEFEGLVSEDVLDSKDQLQTLNEEQKLLEYEEWNNGTTLPKQALPITEVDDKTRYDTDQLTTEPYDYQNVATLLNQTQHEAEEQMEDKNDDPLSAAEPSELNKNIPLLSKSSSHTDENNLETSQREELLSSQPLEDDNQLVQSMFATKKVENDYDDDTSNMEGNRTNNSAYQSETIQIIGVDQQNQILTESWPSEMDQSTDESGETLIESLEDQNVISSILSQDDQQQSIVESQRDIEVISDKPQVLPAQEPKNQQATGIEETQDLPELDEDSFNDETQAQSSTEEEDQSLDTNQPQQVKIDTSLGQIPEYQYIYVLYFEEDYITELDQFEDVEDSFKDEGFSEDEGSAGEFNQVTDSSTITDIDEYPTQLEVIAVQPTLMETQSEQSWPQTEEYEDEHYDGTSESQGEPLSNQLMEEVQALSLFELMTPPDVIEPLNEPLRPPSFNRAVLFDDLLDEPVLSHQAPRQKLTQPTFLQVVAPPAEEDIFTIAANEGEMEPHTTPEAESKAETEAEQEVDIFSYSRAKVVSLVDLQQNQKVTIQDQLQNKHQIQDIFDIENREPSDEQLEYSSYSDYDSSLSDDQDDNTFEPELDVTNRPTQLPPSLSKPIETASSNPVPTTSPIPASVSAPSHNHRTMNRLTADIIHPNDPMSHELANLIVPCDFNPQSGRVCDLCDSDLIFYIRDDDWYLLGLTNGYRQQFRQLMGVIRTIFVNEDLVIGFSGFDEVCLAVVDYRTEKRIDKILEAFSHRSFKNYLKHPLIEIPRQAEISQFDVKFMLTDERFSARNFTMSVPAIQIIQPFFQTNQSLTFEDQQFLCHSIGEFTLPKGTLAFELQFQKTQTHQQSEHLKFTLDRNDHLAGTLLKQYLSPRSQERLQPDRNLKFDLSVSNLGHDIELKFEVEYV